MGKRVCAPQVPVSGKGLPRAGTLTRSLGVNMPMTDLTAAEGSSMGLVTVESDGVVKVVVVGVGVVLVGAVMGAPPMDGVPEDDPEPGAGPFCCAWRAVVARRNARKTPWATGRSSGMRMMRNYRVGVVVVARINSGRRACGLCAIRGEAMMRRAVP